MQRVLTKAAIFGKLTYMRISVRDLKKEYDLKTMGLDGVTLEAGEDILTVVGAPGSGKTTLLFCIAGLLNATEGKIFFGDRDVTDVDIKLRDVCLMREGQNPSKGSVYDNISYGLRLRRVDRREVRERSERAAELLGLTDKLGVKMSALSELDRRRVSLARAAARRAEVFLLDEPLFALEEGREELIADIVRTHGEIGGAWIISSSQGEDAFVFGGRTAVMRSGRVLQAGSAEEITEAPTDMFVASFVGDEPMNFIGEEGGYIGFRSSDASVGESGKYVGKVESASAGKLCVRINEDEPPVTVRTDFAASAGDRVGITPRLSMRFDEEGKALTKYSR